MEQNDMRYQRKKDSRIWSGLILLTVGVLLLAYKMGAPIPHWVFTWPVLLIAMGFLTGVKSRFHNPGAFIMMIVGGVFLVDQNVPGISFHNYLVPAILIGIGLVFILRPRRNWDQRFNRHWENRQQSTADYKPAETSLPSATSSAQGDNAEYIEINAVFGGVKKLILSKNFKGGELNSFMGGSELNLMQADILQPVVLEVHNVFGGTKLIIPANWDVRNEVTAIFGGIDDKRSIHANMPDANKTIILKGACIFGGIEVANY
jgi:predicted membrane protein